MKCLNCQNFVTAHAFLTGWHLFTFFTVAPFLCTPSTILIISVASNTVIWSNLFGAHRFKLEVEDFIFHVLVFSRETFQTLACKFLLCIPQRVFRVYIFPDFVLVQHIVVQILVKTRSGHRRCSLRKGVLRNFPKFTGKHLNTCARVSIFIKLQAWYRCFPVNFSKLVRSPFLQNTSARLLL